MVGTVAATKAPNTISSTASVSGIDRSPACLSWLSNAFEIALSELTAPASPTKKSR